MDKIFLLLFFSLQILDLIYAKANVTLQLGLSYNENPECEESPYVVTVCVGEKKQKCSIYPSTDFYLQADCATNELPKVVEFVSEKLDTTLIITANIKPLHDSAHELRPVEAVLSKSREISMTSDKLLFVLRFRVSYACVANYFGLLCDVYCASDATEYECTSSGEKICTQGYIKEHATGECITDKCKMMLGYCLNNGTCINHSKNVVNTEPICSCQNGFEGIRCENAYEIVKNMTDTVYSNSNPGKTEVQSDSSNSLESVSKSSMYSDEANRPSNYRQIIDYRVPIASVKSPNDVQNLLQSDKSLWSQVLIFTSATICLTLLVCSLCLGTACYVYRLKKKTKSLRQDRVSSMGELRYIDNDGIPAYVRRISSLGLNFTQSMHRDPSLHSYAAQNRPYSPVLPPEIPDLDTQIIYPNRNTCQWPPLRLNGNNMQQFWDYRSETPMYDCRMDSMSNPDRDMLAETTASRNSDIYSCRTMLKYMNPELNENLVSDRYGTSVNSMSLRRDRSGQLISNNVVDRASFSPTKFMMDSVELKKSMIECNGYKHAVLVPKKDPRGEFEPPTAFADTNCSVLNTA